MKLGLMKFTLLKFSVEYESVFIFSKFKFEYLIVKVWFFEVKTKPKVNILTFYNFDHFHHFRASEYEFLFIFLIFKSYLNIKLCLITDNYITYTCQFLSLLLIWTIWIIPSYSSKLFVISTESKLLFYPRDYILFLKSYKSFNEWLVSRPTLLASLNLSCGTECDLKTLNH